MRLIDADALKRNFEANTPAFAQDMVPGICSIIDRARTIDAVPVKRGVWVTYTDGSMHCSNCSKIPINRIYVISRLVYDVDIGSMMKYCPHCGARMDGEDGTD